MGEGPHSIRSEDLPVVAGWRLFRWRHLIRSSESPAEAARRWGVIAGILFITPVLVFTLWGSFFP